MKHISFLALILLTLSCIPAAHAGGPDGSQVPGIPAIVPGTVAADQSIEYNTPPHLLNATAPTGGTQPYVYQWQSSIDNNSFANISGGTDLFYQPGALTTTTWYRQVQYSAGKIDSAYTNTIRIFVYGMSVDDLNVANFDVYPNPTGGKVTVKSAGKTALDIFTVDVYNECGVRIFASSSGSLPVHEISLENYPPGVYFFRLNTSKSLHVIRVIRK